MLTVRLARIEVRDPADPKRLDHVLLMCPHHVDRVPGHPGTIPRFNHPHARVERPKPPGADGQRNDRRFGRIVDDDEDFVHFTKRGLDDRLVAAMERGKLAEGEPSLDGHAACPTRAQVMSRIGVQLSRIGKRCRLGSPTLFT